MVDRIPSKYGVSIVQKWKHFVAIPIAGRWAALAVYDTCLRLRADNKAPQTYQTFNPDQQGRIKCRRHVLFQRPKQFRRRGDTKKLRMRRKPLIVARQYNLRGKRHWWRGCCGRIWLAGSNSPGIRSTSRLTQSEAKTSSRLWTAPTEAASSSLVKYLALFIDSLFRVFSLTEFPAKISRSMFELKFWNMKQFWSRFNRDIEAWANSSKYMHNACY